MREMESMSFSYSDYHFTGKGKPWFNGPPSGFWFIETKTASAEHLWWYTDDTERSFDMGIVPAGSGKQESTSVRYWE
jgi:hypothetical protein